MYNISDFSRITSFTTKTLRYYDEIGLLSPRRSAGNDYRYYVEADLEKAFVIKQLKFFDLPLKQIKEILNNCSNDDDIKDYLLEQLNKLEDQFSINVKKVKKIKQVLRNTTKHVDYAFGDIQEKNINDCLVASIEHVGPYKECSRLYSKLFSSIFRNTIKGSAPGMLIHDEDYKEQAHYAVFAEIKNKVQYNDPIEVRELKGGKALILCHKGPYEELGKTYKKLMKTCEEKKLEVIRPTREVYLKGPGMIFKGNPKKYITEIQFFIGY